MRHFILKSLFFVFLTSLAYLTFGFIAEKIIASNLNKSRFLLQADWHIRHNAYNECLYIGNSRTWVHVDAEMITNAVHKKSYCLAQDGREAKILFWKLKTYLLFNRNPKEIFIQFDPYFISNRNDGTFYGKKNYLGYIFGDRLKINKIFSSEIGFNKYDEFVPLIRYFQTKDALPHLIAHLSGVPINQSPSFKYGSELQIRDWATSSRYFDPEETKIELNFNYIDSIVNLCKSIKIKPILIYSPQTYTSYKKVSQNTLSQLKNYSQSRDLKFWDFNSQSYNDSTLFYNHMHLNHVGAKKFTSQLIDSLTSSKSNQNHQGSN